MDGKLTGLTGLAEKPKDHATCSSVKWVTAPASGDHCGGTGDTDLGKHRLWEFRDPKSSPHPQYCGKEASQTGRSWAPPCAASERIVLLNRLRCLADFSQKASVGNPSSIPPSVHLLLICCSPRSGQPGGTQRQHLAPCILPVLPSFAPRYCRLFFT